MASVTSVNGILNGNVGPYTYGFCPQAHCFTNGTAYGRIIPELAKYLMLIQNLVVPKGTLNTPHEVIDAVYRDGKHRLLKLAPQSTNLLYDLGGESYGFNRLEKESVSDYIARMQRSQGLYGKEDYSLHEFPPQTMQHFNPRLKTHGHTYYFSVSTSLKGTRLHTKPRDMLLEPAKTTMKALGFELDVLDNVMLQGKSLGRKELEKERRRKKLSWFMRHFMKLKYWISPLNLMGSITGDNCLLRTIRP